MELTADDDSSNYPTKKTYVISSAQPSTDVAITDKQSAINTPRPKSSSNTPTHHHTPTAASNNNNSRRPSKTTPPITERSSRRNSFADTITELNVNDSESVKQQHPFSILNSTEARQERRSSRASFEDILTGVNSNSAHGSTPKSSNEKNSEAADALAQKLDLNKKTADKKLLELQTEELLAWVALFILVLLRIIRADVGG